MEAPSVLFPLPISVKIVVVFFPVLRARKCHTQVRYMNYKTSFYMQSCFILRKRVEGKKDIPFKNCPRYLQELNFHSQSLFQESQYYVPEKMLQTLDVCTSYLLNTVFLDLLYLHPENPVKSWSWKDLFLSCSYRLLWVGLCLGFSIIHL